MKRLSILFLFCMAALYARPAAAQGNYFDGVPQNLANVCPITGTFEPAALSTWTGYFTNGTNLPSTGDTVYVRAYAANASACSNDAVGFEFFLPDGASLDISPTNPVFCTRGRFDNSIVESVPNDANGSCSQAPSVGSHNGWYFGFSALPNVGNWWLDIRVPVRFNKQLLGIAGPASHQLQVATSSVHGLAVPVQAVTVFYRASFASLATTGVTTTGANVAFNLNSYFHSGTLFIDYGTTNPPPLNGSSIPIPDTSLFFTVTSTLSGLNPSTNYFWRARLVTTDGTFTSLVQPFTTSAAVAQTLTVSNAGTGTGTVTSSPAGINCGATCSASYAFGTSVTLAATPAAGSSFAGWTGSGCTGTGSCVVAMSAAQSVAAQFTRQMGSLSVTLGGLPAGTIVTLGITGPDGYNTTHATLTGTGFNLSDVPTGTYTVTPPLTTVGSTHYSAPVQSVPVNFGTTGTINVAYAVQVAPAIPNDFDGNGSSDLAVFRPAGGTWFINGLSSPSWGLPSDIPVPGDYNGDGTTDIAVYRPSTGGWFIRNGSPAAVNYGRTGDIPVPADYNGDKKTDLAVYRTTDGNTGVWYLNLPGQAPVAWGRRGDVPMPGDYDGDGRADIAVYRPGTGEWFVLYAAGGFTTASTVVWGGPGDLPIRADVDGDGKLDFVFFRPSNGTWFLNPTNSGPSSIQFGLPGDIPLALDTDGDGSAELCVWRPSTGQWFIRNRVTSTTTAVQFGLPGDIPLGARPHLPSVSVSDFDGDGISDMTVFRPSTGTWYTRFSVSGFSSTSATQLGLSTDIPVNSDYDGDHRADVAVFRPATGQWFILQSSTGTVVIRSWGLPGDQPMPADYDGDGRTDLAVFRPSSGQWFVLYSSSNTSATTSWGLPSDKPFAKDFDGDGRADLALYRPSTGQWFLQLSTTPFGATIVRQWGLPTDVPMPGDFDGDGRSELVIFRPSTGEWLGIDALTGVLVVNQQWGLPGDIPTTHDYDGDGVSDPTVFRPASGFWFIRRSTTGGVLNVQWGLSGDQPR